MKTPKSNNRPLSEGHDWVQQRLSAYLDGDLPADEQAQMQSHLSSCAACKQDLDTLRQTVTWLKQLPEQPLPRSFLLPATPVKSTGWSASGWLSLLFGSATAMAALLFIVVVSLDILQTAAPLRFSLSAPARSAAIAPTFLAPSSSLSAAGKPAKEEAPAEGSRAKAVPTSISPLTPTASPARRDLLMASPQTAAPAQPALRKALPAPAAPPPPQDLAPAGASSGSEAISPAPPVGLLTDKGSQDYAFSKPGQPTPLKDQVLSKPANEPEPEAQLGESRPYEGLSATVPSLIVSATAPGLTYTTTPTATLAPSTPSILPLAPIPEVTPSLPTQNSLDAGPPSLPNRWTWRLLEAALLAVLLASLAAAIWVRRRAHR